MISITAVTYDPSGVILFPHAKTNNPYSANRRSSVVDTLDGSVSIYDTGFSESDQVITIDIINPTIDILQKLKYLISHYSQIRLAFLMGVYTAILSTTVNKNRLTISARLIEKLDGIL
ncbi:MAG: hypothetical protein IPK54_10600 [Dokdonella sp.]|uniref:hypothetical protein n=1 Tax=Dokdonella sp. TaxID=2291710 RepID=UPI0025B86F21|nr:hypothetical protein [Dokdonella sp.]MBK8123980.1 hypothetical protein [Dokdonella sp.]